jgi:hypothetical protein
MTWNSLPKLRLQLSAYPAELGRIVFGSYKTNVDEKTRGLLSDSPVRERSSQDGRIAFMAASSN